MRVNAHGSVEDVNSFVEAFVEAARVLQSGDYDAAFDAYGEAAKLAVGLGQSGGVASACCGQGLALLGANKLKKALKILDSALELNPGSNSISKYLKRSKDLIREKLEEKKRKEHQEAEKAKLVREEQGRQEQVAEKKHWLSKLHQEMEIRNKEKLKVMRVQKDSKFFAKK